MAWWLVYFANRGAAAGIMRLGETTRQSTIGSLLVAPDAGSSQDGRIRGSLTFTFLDLEALQPLRVLRFDFLDIIILARGGRGRHSERC